MSRSLTSAPITFGPHYSWFVGAALTLQSVQLIRGCHSPEASSTTSPALLPSVTTEMSSDHYLKERPVNCRQVLKQGPVTSMCIKSLDSFFTVVLCEHYSDLVGLGRN